MRTFHLLLVICLALGSAACNWSTAKTTDTETVEAGAIEGPSEVFEYSFAEYRCLDTYPAAQLPRRRDDIGEEDTSGYRDEYERIEFDYLWSCDPPGAGRFTNPRSFIATFFPSEVDQDTEATITFRASATGLKPSQSSLRIVIRDTKPDEWERTWGRCWANDMAVDAAGNCYVAGRFGEPVDFDPTEKVDEHAPQHQPSEPGRSRPVGYYLVKYGPHGEFLWARTWPGTPGSSHPLRVAVDSAGNPVVTGQFTGTVDFDPGPQENKRSSMPRSYPAFISCFDTNGNHAWVTAVGENSDGSAFPFDIQISPQGNIYLTGGWVGTVDFDPGDGISLERAEGFYCTKTFLLKLGPGSSFQWVKTWGKQRLWDGDSNERLNLGIRLGLDSGENVFVAGEFGGTVDFDPGDEADTHTSEEMFRNIFLTKFTADGDYQWARTFGGPQNEYVFGLDVDGSGFAYISGIFKGTVDFDPGDGIDEHTAATREELRYYACGNHEEFRTTIEGSVFLSKFSPSGDRVWTCDWPYLQEIGGDWGNRWPVSGDLAVDAAGRVFVCSGFSGTIDIDPGTTTHEISSSGVSGASLCLSVLSQDREFLSAFTWSSISSFADCAAVDADLSGNAFVCGTRSVNSYLRKFPLGASEGSSSSASEPSANLALAEPPQPQSVPRGYSGTWSAQSGWVITWTSDRYNRAQGVAVDSTGNLYVTGSFSGTIDFDPGDGKEERTAEGDDIFLAKFTPARRLLWVHAWGSNEGSDYGKDVDVDSQGYVILSGGFKGPIDLDPGPGTVSAIPSTQWGDHFVAKFTESGEFVWAVPHVGGWNIILDDQDNIWSQGSRTDEHGGGYLYNYRLSPSGEILYDERVIQTAGQRSEGPASLIEFTTHSTDTFWLGRLSGVQCDAQGNMFIAGSIREPSDFEPGEGITERTPAGGSDYYLAKYSPEGRLIWVRTWGSHEDWAQEIANVEVDENGNAYVYGTFEAPADFDPGEGEWLLDAYGFKKAFLCRFNPDGSFQWAHSWGGSGGQPNLVDDIAIDSERGFVYVCGWFSGTADFCPGEEEYSVAANPHAADAYVMKIMADGSW